MDDEDSAARGGTPRQVRRLYADARRTEESLGSTGEAATRKQENGAKRTRPADDRRRRDILDALATLVPQIARSVWPDCELVLHDNRTSPPRILAIGNGHVTQRTVGDLMTRISIADVEVRDLREPLYNYLSTAPDGRQMKVSVLPVVIGGETIAYVAVNIILEDLMLAQRALGEMTRTEPRPDEIRETFLPTQPSLSRVIERCLEDVRRPPHLLSREERIALIRRMHTEGAFRMRGAVREIANRLRISRAAVYNYLKEELPQAMPKRGRSAMAASKR